MPAFLEKVSEQIYSSYKDQLGDICIVLPNRRASLFIKKHLAKIIEKTSFLPDFYSIEDFVTQCSGLTIADQLSVQFKLYELHLEIEGKEARSIDEFLPYAAWMYSDFNEIDSYLVDHEKLFGYLSDAKALTLWNPDGRPLSDFEKRYLAFFSSLNQYYTGLNDMLSDENQACQGKAFRVMAENIEEISRSWKWKKVIFAGFNALTKSEETIILNTVKDGQAKVFWDADKYYMEDKKQEAGFFLRHYFKRFHQGEIQWEENNFAEDKNIDVIGVPKNAGQVKYAGEILQKLIDEKGNLDNTAVVLSDESLLIPLMNSIPEEAGRFNVTMGLALKNTPLYELLDSIFRMHMNVEKFSKVKDGSEKFLYSKDLIKIFNHPWVHMMENAGAKTDHDDIASIIKNSYKVFYPLSEVCEIWKEQYPALPEFEQMFPWKPGVPEIIKSFSVLLASIRKVMIDIRKVSEHDLSIELEYLFHFSKLLQRLQDLAGKYQSIKTLKTLYLIFKQLAGQVRIPFYGEPLQGLQVMGMLETRTLDFDTLIMLSVNEGTLPSGRMPNSFIPYDIQMEFGLPTYRHNNAVFAYHFYRLIQRPKDIYLLYNTESDKLGGGEKSQFITQLQHELEKYNPNIKIRENLLSIPPRAGIKENKIIIEKDASVLEKLKEEAKHGFHPSSLNTYIKCPLQFYFSRILKVREIEDTEETIDNRILGIVLHESLKTLLEDKIDVLLNKEDFRQLMKEATKEVGKQFELNFHGGDIAHGKNFLIVNVAVHMLKQFLRKESAWLDDGLELRLLAIEDQFSTSLHIKNDDTDEDIRFTGKIDRVDRKGNETRIIDYKTGSVTERALKPADWEDLFTNPDMDKAFQLMMYAWLYHKDKGDGSDLQAGIFSLRKPGDGPIMLKLPGNNKIEASVLEAFETNLSALMIEIFNPALPFMQTEDENNCKYCSYQEICNRIQEKDSY